MNNYLAFIYGGQPEASKNSFADGRGIAEQCLTQLRQLDDSFQFPPRLLLLFASPAYLAEEDATGLLAGIHSAFSEYMIEQRQIDNTGIVDNIPDELALIGCSAAAVCFKHPELNQRVYERGALL